MTNFVINTTTRRILIAFIADLRRYTTMTFDKVTNKFFNIPTGNAWLNKATKRLMNTC